MRSGAAETHNPSHSEPSESAKVATEAAPQWEAQIAMRASGTKLALIALGPEESGTCIDDSRRHPKLIETQKAEIAAAMKPGRRSCLVCRPTTWRG